MNYTGGAVTHHYPLLRVRNVQKQCETVFVTVLQAFAGVQPDVAMPRLEKAGTGTFLHAAGQRWRLAVAQTEPSRPALVAAG